jgi:hypothetical protein
MSREETQEKLYGNPNETPKPEMCDYEPTSKIVRNVADTVKNIPSGVSWLEFSKLLEKQLSDKLLLRQNQVTPSVVNALFETLMGQMSEVFTNPGHPLIRNFHTMDFLKFSNSVGCNQTAIVNYIILGIEACLKVLSETRGDVRIGPLEQALRNLNFYNNCLERLHKQDPHNPCFQKQKANHYISPTGLGSKANCAAGIAPLSHSYDWKISKDVQNAFNELHEQHGTKCEKCHSELVRTYSPYNGPYGCIQMYFAGFFLGDLTFYQMFRFFTCSIGENATCLHGCVPNDFTIRKAALDKNGKKIPGSFPIMGSSLHCPNIDCSLCPGVRHVDVPHLCDNNCVKPCEKIRITPAPSHLANGSASSE